jgi:hypothetical protein
MFDYALGTDFLLTYFFLNSLLVEAEGIEPSSEVRPAIRASTGLASAFL